MKGSISVRLLCAVFAVAACASASLIQDTSYVPQTGSGIGNVLTLLSVQANHKDPSESGCVGFSSSGDITGSPCVIASDVSDVAGGNEKRGASQTTTRALGEASIANADQIRIVFNGNQPDGGAIDLDKLYMTLWSSTGDLLFTSGAFTPVSLSSTTNGIGTSDIAFKLDDSDLGAISKYFMGDVSADRIGLAATLHPPRSGFDTFFLTSVPEEGGSGSTGGGTIGGEMVPEPGSVYMLLGGLAAVFAAKRRR